MVADNEKTNVTCQEKKLTRGPHHREVRARGDAGWKKKHLALLGGRDLNKKII